METNSKETPSLIVILTKSSGTGILLSFFWTGLGQLYAGKIGRGIGMMIVTPILWMVGWFGGFSAVVGTLGVFAGAMKQEATTGAAGAGIGLMGIIMVATPIGWWVWGMIDARNLCEAQNQKALASSGKA